MDVQKVIDAATAKVKERLDADVTAGRLSQADADKRLVEATDRITKMVNGELPNFGDGGHGGRGGHGGPGKGGPGKGGPGAPGADQNDNSSSTTVPTLN